MTFKFSGVPYVSRRGGVLASLELDAPTASSAALGTGKWVLAPSIAYGIFLPGNCIFAPAYKQSDSFAGNANRSDINAGNLDFYFVSRFDHGRQWAILDPTYILNYEAGRYGGASLRVTYGRMFGKVGDAVLSGYVKPGIGIGADRPYNWSLEMGVSLVGF
jgi:hypothetical protein